MRDSSNTGRIARRFAALGEERRGGLVTFLSAGDPDADRAMELLRGLPAAGADLIELGMPFTDPMADGPAIQASSLRALKAGQTMGRTLSMVREFRRADGDTPVVLFGYNPPIYIYGNERFLADAVDAGVDGLIVVDLPPEEDAELSLPALAHGLRVIRRATPTTDDARLERVLANASGFVYYVSITGVTGAGSAPAEAIGPAVDRLRRHTELPIAVGFGIRTPEQAAEVAGIADAAVVGSALVERIKAKLDEAGRPQPGLVEGLLDLVGALARGVRGQG